MIKWRALSQKKEKEITCSSPRGIFKVAFQNVIWFDIISHACHFPINFHLHDWPACWLRPSSQLLQMPPVVTTVSPTNMSRALKLWRQARVTLQKVFSWWPSAIGTNQHYTWNQTCLFCYLVLATSSNQPSFLYSPKLASNKAKHQASQRTAWAANTFNVTNKPILRATSSTQTLLSTK